MVAKAFFVFCATALLVQSISAQCCYGNGLGLANNYANVGLAGARLAGVGCGLGAAGLAAPIAVASGGGLAITSSSPIAPTGVSVVSDNAIEGPVEVAGQLPVLSAVALEGALPTGGAAGTSYSCGDGQVGIAGESLAAAGVGASSLAGARLGAGLVGAGINNAGLVGAGINNAGLIGAAGINGAGLARFGRLGSCGCY